MDLYHVALFLHIMALVVASGATAVMKLATSRRVKARTIGEVLDWHRVMLSTSRIFPAMLAVFVITGGYMISVNRVNAGSTGFVVAGFVGVLLLLASGVFLGTKGKALTPVLEGMVAKNGADAPAPRMAPPPLVAALPIVNTTLAIAVAFDMVTKPTSIPVALGVVAIGIIVGFAAGMRRPAPAPEQVPAA